jgi:hypothetical protein
MASVVVSCSGTGKRKTCTVMEGDDVTMWDCKKNRSGAWSCKQYPDLPAPRTGSRPGTEIDVVRAVLDAKLAVGPRRKRTSKRR